MGNSANKVSLRDCPNCGLELPASGWQGLCPRCLVLVSLRGTLQPLAKAEAGLESQSQLQAGETIPAKPHSSPEPAARAPLLVGGKASSFGDYQLLEEIGRGGMGMVFKARQLSLNRIVAVKLLLPGPLAGGQTLERFRAEAEAVAQLQHPNIVAIYETGQHEGAPFFSMEYVPGRTLAELVAHRPLPAYLAARYLRTIAAAIHYAHEHGIVHRDLKPSNVLIDAADHLRVTDFGLAKRLPSHTPHRTSPISGPSTFNPELTMTGQILGSPSYVAPEQAEARRGQVGPASDIYALGAILFHLLTGRPPFLSETLEGTLLQVLTTEPVGVRRLNPAVPRDLETICSKCLQKDPKSRYESAEALADDLRRFLQHEPILARPANPVEKLGRWCQRRPALAAILLLLHLSFAAGLSGILWQWRRAHRGELALQQNLYAADINLAQVALEDNNVGRAAALLQRHIPGLSGGPDLRGFEWCYLRALCQGDELATLQGDGSIVSCVRFSPDGRLLATAGFDRAVTIWDAASRRAVTRLTGLSGPICRLALDFSPNGRMLATAGGTNLLVWNTADWTIAQQWEAHSAALGGGAYQVVFTPDGQGLAARLNQDLYLWQTATWRGEIALRDAIDESRSLLTYSADGKTVATFSDEHIRFWDSDTRLQRASSIETLSQPCGMAFSCAGNRLAVVDISGKLRLMDPRTGATVSSVEAHKGFAQGVTFSPDGKSLATCGTDQLVRLWELESLKSIATFKGHRSEVWSVAFSPDGGTLASGGKDGTVKLWSVRPKAAEEHRLDYTSYPIWFSYDSNTLLTRNRNGSLDYWDVGTGRHRRAIPPLQIGSERLATTVSSDGKRLATSVQDGRVFLWDLERETCIATNQIDLNPVNALAFSPDDRRLALTAGQYVRGAWRGGTKILDLTSGHVETVSCEYSGTAHAACVAFSPDGRLLARAGPDYTIRIWDLATKAERMTLKGHTWDVMNLAFSPDGKLLASAGNDNTARLWDLANGSQIASLAGHKAGVIQVAFSPDSRTLATSSNDKTVRLWSVATHGELLTLKPATEWIHLLFSPDGHVLATGGVSGPAELWRAPEGN